MSDRPPEESLDELYENAPCGYLTADAGGTIVRVNATLLGWLNVPRQELVGRRVQTILTAAARILFETHVAPLLSTQGVARQVAIDLRCSDGQRMAVLTDWRSVVTEDRTVGYRAMIVDATERRAYERDLVKERENAEETAAQLRKSEALLRELNETLEARVAEREAVLKDTLDFTRLALSAVSGVGSWTFDVASDRFYCDAAISELYGIDTEQGVAGIPSAGFLANVDPNDRRELAATMADGLNRNGEIELEYRIRHPNGSTRWVMSRGYTYLDREGRAVRRTGVGIETTRQRQLEEQLRQSQKMEAVGQLTGGLAHDFNNLLAGISGALELMQVRVQQGRFHDVERYVVAAQGASTRAAALTHRLLAFSRRQTLDPKPTDVNRLVAGMRELVQRTVGPAIPIEVVAPSGVWAALVDPSQLENALLNLCINARDAMPDGGRIIVETANKGIDKRSAHQHDVPEGQYLTLSVTDTGTGMTPEVLERVFEPFFTTKPLGEGTGLGLSMIYGFAQQSGGQVRITSEVNKGTTVTVYLPRHHGEIGEEAGLARKAILPRAERGETVLIVDDEPTVRMLVTDILEDLGYTAIEASDSAAGLVVLRSEVHIDLLVTDVGLPGGMNGRQMADAARVARPDLKVLFITGYAEKSVIGNGRLAPGMAVLTKPFSVETMAARIRTMIEEARPQ